MNPDPEKQFEAEYQPCKIAFSKDELDRAVKIYMERWAQMKERGASDDAVMAQYGLLIHFVAELFDGNLRNP